MLAEAADVGRYVVQARLNNTVKFEATSERLLALREALKAHPNPYLQDDPF